MNKIQTSITATAIATALSLPLAGAAFAETTSVFDEAQPMMLAASDTVDAAEHTADEAGEAMSDTWITTKVKTRMLKDKALDVTRIKVITENGEVFLLGVVSRDQADLAVDIARNTAGVRKVVKVFDTPSS